MRPSQVYRQQRQNDSFMARYWTSQSPRNKFLIASTAAIIVSAGAYYWVYDDVERKHSQTQTNNKRR